MSWIKGTFMGVDGRPSFKRQALAIIILSTIIGTFASLEVGALAALAGVISAMTVAERSKRIM